MTDENTLRHVWQRQASNGPAPSLDAVRARARTFERRLRRRNLIEYAAALFVIAVLGPAAWTDSNRVAAAGGGLLIAATLLVVYRVHQAGGQTLPPELGVRSSLAFHRAELERQRDLLRRVWRWYLLPFVPGMGLLLLGRLLERPERWPIALGTAVLAVAIGLHVAWLNARAAAMLDEQIDRLDEDPVTALATTATTLHTSDRVGIWVVRALVGATVAGIVVRLVAPTLPAPLAALTGVPGGIVLLSVLALVGVALQAGWWMLRGR